MAARQDHRVRLAQLDLPSPLESQFYRALRGDNVDQRHERLVLAWEATARILAATLFAHARRRELRSPELDQARSTLSRPSFGHWTALLRACRTLLLGAEDPSLGPLVAGLEAKVTSHPAIADLATRLRELPGKSVQAPKTVFDLLSSMPTYRNAAQSTHQQVDAGLRAANVDALADALVAVWEVAPPVGHERVVVLRQLARTDAGLTAEVVEMHGPAPVPRVVEVEREVWDTLSVGQVYLVGADDRFTSLHPLAAASATAEGWALGWLEGKVHAPTLQYASEAGATFRVTLAPADLQDLLRVDTEQESEVSDEILALDPYRGLLAYDEAHAPMFFGREEELASAVSRLASDGALVLCGASGSGKSSLARAGIVPRLREKAASEGREVVVTTLIPGEHPMAALRQALTAVSRDDPAARASWSATLAALLPDHDPTPKGLVHALAGLAASASVVLVVDQLEEASRAKDRAEAHAFLEVVAVACVEARAIPAAVVLTVRADQLADLFEHEGIRDVVERRLMPLGPIGPTRLGRIVTEPLRGRRVRVEAGLVDTILREVGDAPGALALLSQVLTTLWEERGRHGGALTLRGYEEAGRVAGALQTQADATLTEVTDHAALDRVLVELAHVTQEGAFVRRRVARKEMCEATDVAEDELVALIEPFVRRRLVVAGEGGALEVAHEALLTGWRYYEALLRGQKEALALRREVLAATNTWVTAGRRSELWSDSTSHLRRAEELRRAGRLGLTRAEDDFLAASRRSVTRRRALERVVTVAAAALAITATLLYVRTRKALVEVRTAQVERAKSDDARLAMMGAAASVLALQSGHEAEAVVKALEGWAQANGAPSAPLVDGLVGAVYALASLPLRPHTQSVAAIDIVRFEGVEIVATGSLDRSVKLWDGRRGGLLATLGGHSAAVRSVSFSPTGDRLVSASSDGTARLWNVATGAVMAVLPIGARGPKKLTRAHFSPDGGTILSLGESAHLWDGKTGASLRVLALDGTPNVGAYDLQGQRVVIGHDKGVRIFRVRDGVQVAEAPFGHPVYATVASPKGDSFLTLSSDQIARVFDWTGKLVATAEPGERVLWNAAWSPDATLAAISDHDGNVQLWEPGGATRTFRAHDTTINALVFSADGARLMTASSDRTVRVHGVKDLKLLAEWRGHRSEITVARANADRTSLVTAGYDAIPRLWDVQSGLAAGTLDATVPPTAEALAKVHPPLAEVGLRPLRGHVGAINRVAWSADGRFALTTGDDHTARVWDVGRRTEIAVLTHTRRVTAGAISPDGSTVATSDEQNNAWLWTVADGSKRPLVGHFGTVSDLVLTAGRVFTAGEDGWIRAFDAVTAKSVLSCAVGARMNSLDVTRDGKTAAAAVVSIPGAFALVDLAACTTKIVQAHDDYVMSVRFAPEGLGVVTGSDDHTLRLFNRTTRARLGQLDGHLDWVLATAFSPNSKLLVSASADKTVRLWDVERRVSVGTIHHEAFGRVFDVVFSADGRFVLTGSEDGIARVLPTEASDYVAIGCGLLRGQPEFAAVKAACGP